METTGPVLLFDGDCGLCVRCVKLLLVLDRKRRLKFAPLQGAAAQAYLRERGLSVDDFDSAIFVADWALQSEQAPVFKTDALLAALCAVGGFWKIVAVVHAVPRGWRDTVYGWVARRRAQFFEPARGADFLTAEQKDRFLP